MSKIELGKDVSFSTVTELANHLEKALLNLRDILAVSDSGINDKQAVHLLSRLTTVQAAILRTLAFRVGGGNHE